VPTLRVNAEEWNSIPQEERESISNIFKNILGDEIEPDPNVAAVGISEAAGATTLAFSPWCRGKCYLWAGGAATGCASLPPPLAIGCELYVADWLKDCLDNC